MKRQMCWLTVAVVAVAGLVGGATEAAAYKRTQTCSTYGMYECRSGETPKPIAWPVRCVRYRINEEGSSDFSDGNRISEELRGYIRGAFQTWNDPSCSDFTMVEGPLTSNETVRYKKEVEFGENMNLIVFRDEEWPHGKSTFALTSVTYSAKTGRIADADMEVNSTFYDFAHLSESKVGKTDKVDISNTLTHEVGHFLGLAHPPDKEEATMHGRAPIGEIKKRTLHQDDINGLCAIYPGDDKWGTCEYPEDFKPDSSSGNGGDKRKDSSCCSVGSGPVPKGSALFGGLVLLLLRLRVRRGS